MRDFHWLSMASFAVLSTFPTCGIAASANPPPLPSLAPPAINYAAAASTTAAYWTPDRMAKAAPMDVRMAAPANATRQTAAPGATGVPGAAGGTPPVVAGLREGAVSQTSPSPVVTLRAKPSAEPDNVVAPADGSYPGPNDTYYYGPKYRLYPISTIGKLFFHDPQGGDYQCSATATYGGGNSDTIWTAGHCVGAGGGQRYYTNFLFCPSYDSDQGGANPAVGCWGWSQAQLTGGWYYGGSFTTDYAWIRAAPTGSVLNTHVVSAVGGLGFAWNYPRDQAWQHYGYPAQSPWPGGKMVVTTTEHRYDDNDADSYGSATNAWGSGQTPGSSGSGVLLNFSYSGAYLNSNVSFYYTSPTNEYGKMLHGPYYDTNACNFWKGGTGYTGTC